MLLRDLLSILQKGWQSMKISHEFLQRPAVEALFNALGFEKTYIVGGAVRDAIIGRVVNDIDFATPLLPDEIITHLEKAKIKFVPTGIEHGTISAIIDKKPYEITSFRKDIETFGRHANVEFTNDIKPDAKRRDFTINALYCNKTGEVFDPTGKGIDDLKSKKIAFVGNPVDRIKEDYLRILRLFRFFAQLDDFSIDNGAIDACQMLGHNIPKLSRERINVEIMKILGAKNAPKSIDLMDKSQILFHVIGENYNLDKIKTLWANQRLIDVLPNPIRSLIAILPYQSDYILRFCVDLRLSNKEKAILLDMVKMADFLDNDFNIKNLKIAAFKFGKSLVLDFILSNMANCYEIYQELSSFEVPNFPIDGQILMKHNVKSGPNMGKILQNLEKIWLENNFKIDDDKIKQEIEKLRF